MSESVSEGQNTARARLYRAFEPTAWPGEGLSPLNRIMFGLIVIAVVVAVIETEDVVTAGRESFFVAAEILFATIFLVEYVARVWVSAEDERFGPGLAGRLRYMATWPAIVDIMALAPVLLLPFGSETFLLRLMRLARILRVARLGRFSRAITLILDAIRSRAHELLLSAAVGVALLLVTSTFLYLAEVEAQPDQFGSIPRAMWWSVATLTTVGYGDVYPVTALGRLFAALTAITGIGLIAMPTGILAAAVSDAIQRRRAADEE